VKRVLVTTAALAAAVVVFTLVELPPLPARLGASPAGDSIPGVLHVHTNRSDGRGTPDDIAAAAAKAGLKFLVFTDHGDATRTPDPPSYRAGVLCLDGVEISTTGGHYIAIGLPASPYPLGGESRDVVADVRRLGGFGIAAHPDSPKAELRWTDWDAPIDGIELLNLDTAWRVHAFQGGAASKFELVRALFTYPVRGPETIGRLLTRSSDLDDRWATLTARGPVVGLAGVDAHANLALVDTDPANGSFALPVPSYDASFRVVSVHVALPTKFGGEAVADARALLEGLRGGRLYTAVDAWAGPAAFEFTAANRHGSVGEGASLDAGGPVTLHVRSNRPDGFVTAIWRNTDVFREQPDSELTVAADDTPAVYRVTIRDPARPDAPPWLLSNPIYVRTSRTEAPEAPARETARLSLFDGHSTAGWTRESDANSMSAIEAVQMVSGVELRLRYGLSGGSPTGQYAGAAVETTHGVAGYDRVAFTIRAERPTRLSVQVRAEVPGEAPERWQRSIYLDAADRDETVSFADMRPVGATHSLRAPAAGIRAIMFIVDTTNSRPGASGRIWIKNVRLAG
jgi:hypothetical protein